MRIRPILFNTEMVKAILDERKTATRRVMKPANPFRNKEGYCQGNGLWIDGYSKNDEPNGHIKDYSISSCWMTKEYYIEKYAPYSIGDIMYVRETWFQFPYGTYHYLADERTDRDREYFEAATDTKWHPSLHMPKAAARIWLKVTDVRVERLQDMRLDDFLNEGIIIRPEAFNDPENAYMQGKTLFIKVWNPTIKKTDLDRYGWEANPWVWVIEFERCEKPESEERRDKHGR